MAKVKHQREVSGETSPLVADPWPRGWTICWEVIGLALGASLIFAAVVGFVWFLASRWGF